MTNVAAVTAQGKVFAERYHVRIFKTSSEARAALRNVQKDVRNHSVEKGQQLAPDCFDPMSSAAWFGWWREPLPTNEPW